MAWATSIRRQPVFLNRACVGLLFRVQFASPYLEAP